MHSQHFQSLLRHTCFIHFIDIHTLEFLSFLLDGLHEDLNRVVRKPVVTRVSTEGLADAAAAAECWRTHLFRNQSIIVDIFHGMLRFQPNACIVLGRFHVFVVVLFFTEAGVECWLFIICSLLFLLFCYFRDFLHYSSQRSCSCTGMYKSSVKCPKCDKSDVSFDPFACLSGMCFSILNN